MAPYNHYKKAVELELHEDWFAILTESIGNKVP
jgi:hypothetical protein